MLGIVAAWYELHGTIRVLFDDDTESVTADNSDLPLRQQIAEWQELGNTISPYALAAPSKTDVDEERDRRIANGFTVTLTSGLTIPVQTRSLVDFRNISGLATSALALKTLGSTDLMYFRGADDVTYELSLDDAIEMGLKVSAAVSAFYAASWVLKALTDIPADYKNDSPYWPLS